MPWNLQMWPRWLEAPLPNAWQRPPAAPLPALLATLRRLAPSLASCRDLDPPLDAQVMDELWRAGLFSLTVPADAGGSDAGLRDFCLAMHGVGQLGPAYAMVTVPHLCISVKAVAQLAAEPWRGQILQGVVERREMLVFAITEDQGSDLATMQTRLLDDGTGGLRLQGRKQWITNLDRARYAVVAARNPPGGAPGCTLVLVDLQSPGVQFRADAWQKRCANGAATGDIYFDAVAISPAHILGGLGQGMAWFQRLVQPGRLGAAAALIGMADAALQACTPALGEDGLRPHRTELDLALASVLACAAIGDTNDPDFAALTALVKHDAGCAAQQVLEALASQMTARQHLAPPVLERGQRAAGLFRLLKGPGEVIALQALTGWLGRARAPLPPPATLPMRLRWGLLQFGRQLAALGGGGASLQPAALAAATEMGAAVHGLWVAQHLAVDGALALPEQRRRDVQALAWQRLRARVERRPVADDAQAIAKRFATLRSDDQLLEVCA